MNFDAFLTTARTGRSDQKSVLTRRLIRFAVEWTGVSELYRIQERIRTSDGIPFPEAALSAMDIRCSVPVTDLERIPRSGPLVVVANHPLSMAESLVLLSLLDKIRPDVRILGNSLAAAFSGMQERLIPVDPFGRSSSVFRNGRSLGMAMRWLRGGGALLIFPAGEVSSFRIREAAVTDRPWNAHAAALARRSGAAVVPVYIHGRNSLLFYAAGVLHPSLRTLMLGREFLRCRGKTVAVAVGRPVSSSKIRGFESDEICTDFLRARTYILGKRHTGERPDRSRMFRIRQRKNPSVVPVGPPVDPALLAQEINGLTEARALVRQDPFTVYLAEAEEIPNVLREIGRLREITFRAVGEGTGSETDIDRFDRHYLHLFLWDRASRRIAGAYRLGPVDRIIETEGLSGLYTHTLFRFQLRFFREMGGALELGRSFVTGDYQKQYQCLSLLWRGIGEVVNRNLGIRFLFGPVSISRDYRPFSKRLMVRFLKRNRMDRSLARFVQARSPYREGGPVVGEDGRIQRSIRDVSDADLLVSEYETDGKGMPVLLRHYLRLNAVLLSFNVDRNFSSVVDGLILVDLIRSDPSLLNRFLGRDWSRRFIERHGRIAAETAADAAGIREG